VDEDGHRQHAGLGRLTEAALATARWFIPPELAEQGSTVVTRAMALILVSPVFVLATWLPSLAQLIDGVPTPLPPLAGGLISLGFLLTPLVLRWSKSSELTGAWLLLVALGGTTGIVYRQHGLDSSLCVWFVVIPATAAFFFGTKVTVLAAGSSAVALLGFWLLEYLGWPGSDPAHYVEETLSFQLSNALGALLTITIFGLSWKRVARRIEHERDELEAQIRRGQKLETVGMLAGGIAHDFNNILAAILGHASLLENELRDRRSRRRAEAIVESARRAAVLVEQMLAYAGRAETRTGAIDVPTLVREVVELVSPGLDKNTELVLTLDKPAPLIAADPVQIQQIAMNLVTNASEALDGKRGRVWVETATVDHDGQPLTRGPTADDFVMLEVRDEGCGISPEKLESIFDPFFTTKPSGHGLGLAAVLGIVRAHGGDIEVSSTVDEGTSFRVLLPCPDAATLAATESDDVPRPRIRLPTQTATHVQGAVHRGKRRAVGNGYVLIVDDERMVRELAVEVLELSGIQTLTGVDGDDGLRVFAEHKDEIDLVVLDRTMPGLDGLELLAVIREHRPDVPAVISSGYAEDSGAKRSRSLGVDAVLHKPWAPTDLIHVVTELGMETHTPAAPSDTTSPC